MIIVSSELSDMGIFLYYTIIYNLRVTETPGFLYDMLKDEEERVKTTIGDPSRLTENPVVRAYRKLLWKLGVDPTKVRPSSEALARRVLHGGSLPRVNNVVDIGNLVSLKTLVPIGLYDLDFIKPPLVLKLSEGGKEFAPIGSEGVEKVRKGVPIIVDSRGLVVHIYPHRDSRLSMITFNTKNMLVIVCGAPGVPRAFVKNAADMVARMLKDLNPRIESTNPEVVPVEE